MELYVPSHQLKISHKGPYSLVPPNPYIRISVLAILMARVWQHETIEFLSIFDVFLQ